MLMQPKPTPTPDGAPQVGGSGMSGEGLDAVAAYTKASGLYGLTRCLDVVFDDPVDAECAALTTFVPPATACQSFRCTTWANVTTADVATGQVSIVPADCPVNSASAGRAPVCSPLGECQCNKPCPPVPAGTIDLCGMHANNAVSFFGGVSQQSLLSLALVWVTYCVMSFLVSV